ncbi:MAG: putative toxin-antitoxin system toxin component, PIN family [Methanobacteriota archaeon]
MVRAVFDTNVLVSGILRSGKIKTLVDAAVDGRIQLITSEEIIDEFSRVIKRPKFKLSKEQQNIFVNFVANLASVVETKSDFKVIKDDPADDIILNCAFDGKADYIVSGDEHLLKLKNFRGIKIVSPKEMMEALRLD